MKTYSLDSIASKHSALLLLESFRTVYIITKSFLFASSFWRGKSGWPVNSSKRKQLQWIQENYWKYVNDLCWDIVKTYPSAKLLLHFECASPDTTCGDLYEPIILFERGMSFIKSPASSTSLRRIVTSFNTNADTL